MLRFAPLALSILFLGAKVPGLVAQAPATPLDEPALALAWLDDTRLAVLSSGSVSLHRFEPSRLVPLDRRVLPGPLAVVRHPGGVVLPGDDAFWVLTSGMARAVLYAREGDRLVERARADALPWPDVSGGLRYREGTNLLESTAGLLLTPVMGGLAVDPGGRLLVLSARGVLPSSLRGGSALVDLGDGRVAASSPAPPGSPDSVQILARNGEDLVLRDSLPVPGLVRAIGARRLGAEVRLAIAIETGPGRMVVLFLALRRPGS